MEKSYSASYAAAGVDITAGYRSVELMKQYVARTMTENCIGGLGGFGGLFELDCTGIEHPVLISGTDGVGTKLRIAMLLDKHDTIGIDCVAMCVNDVICAGAKPLGEALLAPTKIYVKPVLAVMEQVTVKGVSHITGGGFYENIPRSIPDGLGAEIKKADVRTLPIFDLIAKAGDIPERDMYNTFNMGVGMSAVVAAEDAEKAVETLKANGVDAYILGKIIKSTDKVVLI